jgi:signal recognition particle GTPase
MSNAVWSLDRVILVGFGGSPKGTSIGKLSENYGKHMDFGVVAYMIFSIVPPFSNLFMMFFQ